MKHILPLVSVFLACGTQIGAKVSQAVIDSAVKIGFPKVPLDCVIQKTIDDHLAIVQRDLDVTPKQIYDHLHKGSGDGTMNGIYGSYKSSWSTAITDDESNVLFNAHFVLKFEIAHQQRVGQPDLLTFIGVYALNVRFRPLPRAGLIQSGSGMQAALRTAER